MSKDDLSPNEVNEPTQHEGEKGGSVGGDDTYIQEDEKQDFLDELEMEMDEFYVE